MVLGSQGAGEDVSPGALDHGGHRTVTLTPPSQVERPGFEEVVGPVVVLPLAGAEAGKQVAAQDPRQPLGTGGRREHRAPRLSLQHHVRTLQRPPGGALPACAPVCRDGGTAAEAGVVRGDGKSAEAGTGRLRGGEGLGVEAGSPPQAG